MTETPASLTARPQLRVLHLEDSELDHALVAAHLRRCAQAVEVLRVDTEATFLAALSEARGWDIIISDYNLPGFSGLRALQIVRASSLPGVAELPFVIVSGEIGEDLAVQAMRHGANDYILKGSMTRLAPAVDQVLQANDERRARQRADAALNASRQRVAELAQHLQTSVDQERAAIAREIHDDVGGALTALRFDLAWLQRHCSGDAVQARLTAALDTLGQALQASKRIMYNLHPAILDQGLVPALQWMVANFSERTGIRAQFSSNREQLQLPAGVPLVVYRTAQECLTNITKHAQASQVTLDLMVSEGVLSMEVSDNGRGLSSDDLGKSASFGLRGLRERAHRVGGWVDVSSAGRGTTVIVSIPLDGGAAAGAAGADTDSDDAPDAAA
ncbi:response regulator [Amphibiibacter pelophylacis]|uniref:Sensor histidine kinase n=1 Tax=Amphibiibacter pelophylacis TaxID=1799477 RepID=A0ACC6P1P0_9BURK